MDRITPELVIAIALLLLVAAPVVWLFISRYFRLKERELQLEEQSRRDWAALEGKMLDARLTALETAVASLSGAVRAQLPQREALEAPQGVQSDPARPERSR
jgi:hypothetical protein